jgi:hypothetical protein
MAAQVTTAQSQLNQAEQEVRQRQSSTRAVRPRCAGSKVSQPSELRNFHSPLGFWRQRAGFRLRFPRRPVADFGPLS